MANDYNRIGSVINAEDVQIGIGDAERLRNIGYDLMFCEKSTKHISESVINASLVAKSELAVYGYRPEDVSDVYGYVEDESLDQDSWRLLLKYNAYRNIDGSLFGLESDYEVQVVDGCVSLAICGLYHMRDSRDVRVSKNEIEIKQTEKRTMMEVPLTPERINSLETKMKRLVARGFSTR